MSHYPDRLQSISDATEKLLMSAPDADVSTLREEISKLSVASARLGRVLRASPSTLPSVKVARFITAAEGASLMIESMIALTGHGPNADPADPVAEKELGAITTTLLRVADDARQEAMRSIRTEIEASSETLSAWANDAEDPHRIAASMIRSEMLADAFVGSDNAGVPALAETRGRGLLSKIVPFQRGPKTVSMSDETMEAAMLYLQDRYRGHANPLENSQRHYAEGTVLTNSKLQERGLSSSIGNRKIVFHILPTIPTVMTPLWEKQAEQRAGDWEALRRALSFKDDPEFRNAVRHAMIMALNDLGYQAGSGVPLPKARIEDPIVRAAVFSTLSAIGANPLHDAKEISAISNFDPFGIRSGIQSVLRRTPGAALRPDFLTGSIGLTLSDHTVSPEGVMATLKETIAELKDKGKYLQSKIFGANLDVKISLKQEAVSACENIGENVIEAMRLYEEKKDIWSHAAGDYIPHGIVCFPDENGEFVIQKEGRKSTLSAKTETPEGP